MSNSSDFFVDSFEVTSSPSGRLASFEASDDLALLLKSGFKSTAFASSSGADLVARLAGVRVALRGAGLVAREWQQDKAPCFICAFHPDLPDGAAAFELRWG